MIKKSLIGAGIILAAVALVIWLSTSVYNSANQVTTMMYSSGVASDEAVSVGGLAMPVAPLGMMKTVSRESVKGEAFSMADGSAMNRLIVRTGNLSLVVQDVNVAIKTIADLASAGGGFVVSSNVYKNGINLAGEISIRIPSDKFDAGTEEIKKLGEVKRQSVDGRDVTEEYVDLDARLHNLSATEKRLLEILGRANQITDVLAVEMELKNIRSEIESLQGRMKYLKESADMSLITVSLATDPSALPSLDDSDSWKPLGVLKAAWRSLVQLAKFAINAVIWLVVFIPLWVIIGAIIWVILRRRHK